MVGKLIVTATRSVNGLFISHLKETSLNKLLIALLIAAGGATSIALAQSTDMAEAEVRKVDRDARKVTLKHGPIQSLDMPAMTMVFQVKDVSLLDKLVAGEKIRFSAQQQQGAYVVTAVEAMPK